jgi:hypothetical protein
MNTIVKIDVQTDDPIIPAEHPDAVHPKWTTAAEREYIAASAPPAILKPATAPQLLRKALDVMEERAKEYDRPQGERSVSAVVTALNAILQREALTEAEGWLFMQLLKNVRLFSARTYHADSGLDGIAYCALMAEAKGKQG